MLSAQILEWPHPQIDNDWDKGKHQWREITPLTYQELKKIPLLHNADDACMKAEPFDGLPDGDGLYFCCKRENDSCFVWLLLGNDLWKRDYVPVPEVSTLI